MCRVVKKSDFCKRACTFIRYFRVSRQSVRVFHQPWILGNLIGFTIFCAYQLILFLVSALEAGLDDIDLICPTSILSVVLFMMSTEGFQLGSSIYNVCHILFILESRMIILAYYLLLRSQFQSHKYHCFVRLKIKSSSILALLRTGALHLLPTTVPEVKQRVRITSGIVNDNLFMSKNSFFSKDFLVCC